MEEIRDVFAEDLYNRVKNILELADFKAKIYWEKRGENEYYVNIKTRKTDGLLIGRNGETLDALQYIVTAIMQKEYRVLPSIQIDVGNYKLKKEKFITKKAYAIAKVVLETRKEMAMDPLTDRELGLAKKILSNIEGIKTIVLTKGRKKNLIIIPK